MLEQTLQRMTGSNNTQFLWFSGKGGTGKTTISSATALELADQGHEVLLISTDPAHSLSDALDQDINGMTSITDTLDALELDPEEEVESFRDNLQMEEFEDAGPMAEMAESMDVMRGGPGMAEMAAMNTFMEHMQSDEYDVLVFDTAPTGHTLTLLELPEVMDSMVGKVLKMRMRFSEAMDTFKSFLPGGEDEEDEEEADMQNLEELKDRIEDARELLTDPNRTTFNFVMLPEKLSVYETERAIEQVDEFDIPTGRIYVNQLIPENEDCQFCTSRHTMQQDNLEDARQRFDRELIEIPLYPHEIHGVEALHELSRHLDIEE